MSELIVKSPFSGQIIQNIHHNTPEEIEDILSCAYDLFQDRNQYLLLYQRIEILEKFCQLLERDRDQLVKNAVLEGGKPWQDSHVEFSRAVNGIKVAIEHASQIFSGLQVPMGQTHSTINRLTYTIKEPIGVVFAISAFNHPINLIIHQVIPAVITGCPVIIKPSTLTPLSCISLVQLLYEAGLPKKWVQVLICDNIVAEKVVNSSKISYLSFIGSSKVGWYLRTKVAKGVRVALEHGGAAPVILTENAELEHAIPALIKGGFYHAGQVCVSVQRVFIHSRLTKVVIEEMVELTKKLTVDDPLSPNTDVGPLISTQEQQRVDSWVNTSIEEGAKILCGGKKLNNNCYAPTLLFNPSADSDVSKHEIFGPVISLYEYNSLDDAISRANNLPVAFQAAVFTQSLQQMLTATKHLNASTVLVNDHTAFRADWMPFGGRKQSGLGVGGIPFSMEEMLESKLVIIKDSLI